MKRSIISSLFFLITGIITVCGQTQNQQPVPQSQPQGVIQQQDQGYAKLGSVNKMTPWMTEIWDPEIRIITPGARDNDPPSDAIILFNGSDLSEWIDRRGNTPAWQVQDGSLISVRGGGDIKTKRKFSNFQLHIEWRTPSVVTGESQDRGNSGVFLQEIYEVQVLDSYNNRTYRDGQAGSLYKQIPPLVNVCRGPGEWQSYDIIYTAPTFGADSISFLTPPRVTVLQNGVLIQNNASFRGPMEYIGIPEYFIKKHGPASLKLQDHSNPVAFRNIWIREL
jgi:hypothetical protein